MSKDSKYLREQIERNNLYEQLTITLFIVGAGLFFFAAFGVIGGGWRSPVAITGIIVAIVSAPFNFWFYSMREELMDTETRNLADEARTESSDQ